MLVFVLLCVSSCFFVFFCLHLDEEENDSYFALIVFLMSCYCKCSVALPHDAVVLSAAVSVFFPVYTNLLLLIYCPTIIMNVSFIALFELDSSF